MAALRYAADKRRRPQKINGFENTSCKKNRCKPILEFITDSKRSSPGGGVLFEKIQVCRTLIRCRLALSALPGVCHRRRVRSYIVFCCTVNIVYVNVFRFDVRAENRLNRRNQCRRLDRARYTFACLQLNTKIIWPIFFKLKIPDRIMARIKIFVLKNKNKKIVITPPSSIRSEL